MNHIVKLIESDLNATIGESDAREGACLLIAQILKELHGGEIVRIDKNGAEHYGVRTEDEEIMDGVGTYEDEEEWIAVHEQHVGEWGGRSVIAGIDPNSEIPGDEEAALRIATKLR